MVTYDTVYYPLISYNMQHMKRIAKQLKIFGRATPLSEWLTLTEREEGQHNLHTIHLELATGLYYRYECAV